MKVAGGGGHDEGISLPEGVHSYRDEKMPQHREGSNASLKSESKAGGQKFAATTIETLQPGGGGKSIVKGKKELRRIEHRKN